MTLEECFEFMQQLEINEITHNNVVVFHMEETVELACSKRQKLRNVNTAILNKTWFENDSPCCSCNRFVQKRSSLSFYLCVNLKKKKKKKS